MSRKLEIIIGYIGAVLTILFLGGFTVVFNTMTKAQYRETLYPVFSKYLKDVPATEGLSMFKTLGSWFGFTAIIVLILVVVANLFLRHNKRIVLAGILYLVAGAVMLFGTQLIAYPLAFIFFVAGVLCLMRKGVVVSDESKN